MTNEWKVLRPHLPRPAMSGTDSAICLEMLIDRDVWAVKRDDPMFDMTRPVLAGYFLPAFQRPLVWDETRMRAFVESALLRLHLGTIVTVEAADQPLDDQGRFHFAHRWLIDGQQRLASLMTYAEGGMKVFLGTPEEHGFDELNKIERRAFDNIQIGCKKIEWTNDEDMRHLYDRLNFGGIAHREEEKASRG